METLLRAHADQREVELRPEGIFLFRHFGDRLFGTARLQPEERLQLAVLHDAILTFRRSAGVAGLQSRRLFAEVDDWFASEETNGPFTFVAICDALNVDPAYIRDGLERWRVQSGGVARRRAAPGSLGGGVAPQPADGW